MKILGPRVAIKVIAEKDKKTESGLFIPTQEAMQQMFPVEKAEVVAVGTGWWQNGIKIQPEVEVGDIVIVPKAAPRVEVKTDDGKTYVAVSEQELVAVLNK